MRERLFLSYRDENGRTRHVEVRSVRFTLGRGQDNDLVIRDAGLSRRHAVLENFEGTVILSDCESQNGTFLNGEPVTGGATLRDGDLITLGEAGTIGVTIGDRPREYRFDGESAGEYSEPLEDSPGEMADPEGAEADEPRDDEEADYEPGEGRRSRLPVLLAAAGVALLATLASVYAWRDGGEREDVRSEEALPSEAPAPSPAVEAEAMARPATGVASAALQPPPAADATDAALEKALQRVMRRVSSDETPYIFPAKALEDVKRQIERYRASPALPSALGALRSNGPEIAALANREGLNPTLVAFAALAETDGGSTGDPGARARALIPDLQALRTTFGGEKVADSSLLILAAYKLGGAGTKRSHPLLPILRANADDVTADRSVWALSQKGKLPAQSYEFVVRFLALGAIAQNPHLFGVDAEPFAM